MVGTARERVIGWYSTGPRLREADLDITELMTNYCDTPLLVICEVQVILYSHRSGATILMQLYPGDHKSTKMY